MKTTTTTTLMSMSMSMMMTREESAPCAALRCKENLLDRGSLWTDARECEIGRNVNGRRGR